MLLTQLTLARPLTLPLQVHLLRRFPPRFMKLSGWLAIITSTGAQSGTMRSDQYKNLGPSDERESGIVGRTRLVAEPLLTDRPTRATSVDLPSPRPFRTYTRYPLKYPLPIWEASFSPRPVVSSRGRCQSLSLAPQPPLFSLSFPLARISKVSTLPSSSLPLPLSVSNVFSRRS